MPRSVCAPQRGAFLRFCTNEHVRNDSKRHDLARRLGRTDLTNHYDIPRLDNKYMRRAYRRRTLQTPARACRFWCCRTFVQHKPPPAPHSLEQYRKTKCNPNHGQPASIRVPGRSAILTRTVPDRSCSRSSKQSILDNVNNNARELETNKYTEHWQKCQRLVVSA
jgi:hypothetical protein